MSLTSFSVPTHRCGAPPSCDCACCPSNASCTSETDFFRQTYPAGLFSPTAAADGCSVQLCAQIFSECVHRVGDTATYAPTSECPPPTPPPPPCSFGDGFTCTCHCCTEGTCPNFASAHYPAVIFSNTGSSDGCSVQLCRHKYRGTCPAAGQGGEVISEFYERAACPPPAPPAPPTWPVVCREAGGDDRSGVQAQQACECRCCADDDCTSMPLRRLPASDASACTPTRCAAEISECMIQSGGTRPRVIASLEDMPACPRAPPTPVPILVLSLGLGIPALVVLVALASCIYCLVRHEKKGTPIFVPLGIRNAGATRPPTVANDTQMTPPSSRSGAVV